MKQPLHSIYTVIGFFVFISCSDGLSGKKNQFRQVDAVSSGIHFTNTPTEKPHLNILYYLYYYNGGGVAAGDINNDGLIDLYFTANSKSGNKLYLNKGNFQFEDITEKAGVAGTSDWCTGVTMADINGDGLLDIYVSAVANYYGLKGHNELFINNGDGTFKEQSAEYRLNFSGLSTQAVFFDYDHDGDLDCYLLNHSKQPHANITDTANRRKIDSLSGDRLYCNQSDKLDQKFVDVSAKAGIYQSSLGYGLGISVADINNDGWEDIYIGNDFHENDYYYINNQDGTFTESGAQHFRHYSRFSMGNDIADYNNDGQPDIVTVDMLPPDEKTLKTYGSDENADIYKLKLESNGYQHQYSRNCLQRNNGNGVNFSDVALMAGMAATDWSWSPLFADFDNDGKKDIFITSGIVKRPVDLDYVFFVSNELQQKKGFSQTDAHDKEAINAMPDGSSHPFFFKNTDGVTFRDMSIEWGTGSMKGYYNGAAYADLDNDGDLDIIINPINEKAVLLRNDLHSKNNFIQLDFKGAKGNSSGIGTKAYIFSDSGIQYQQLMITRGFQSAVPPILHFGLTPGEQVDSVLIVWPDQKYQLLQNPASAQRLSFSYSDAVNGYNPEFFFRSVANKFDDISKRAGVKWQHRENDFTDFQVQYLLPHSQSTRGPRLAVADVNGDGMDDFYAGGAKGQSGILMIQKKDGSFYASSEAVFLADAGSEDVDAVFFDADGNGSPDLLVVSGGNQLPSKSSDLADRLYLNDGKGNFTKKTNAFSIQYENKSCVTAADIDHDGDVDFFTGNLASPTGYGLPKPSYLYLNNGDATFTLASPQIIDLKDPGIITDALFEDMNKDGWMDLIIAGEWTPIKVYMNRLGRFELHEIPGSTGLWQTITTGDINNDGFIDILGGNWGNNSKLWERKNGPLKLYVKDFDNNGTTEQIMAYTIDKKEYPFLAKDELEKAIPVLKKAYLSYKEVAGKTIDYILYDLFKNYRALQAETLNSTAFINDGKNRFTAYPLDKELQLAPVMSILYIDSQHWLAAGNFYGVIPYEGRYDALNPVLFSWQQNKTVVTAAIPWVQGEVRDMKLLKNASGTHTVLIARNNQPLLFLKPAF